MWQFLSGVQETVVSAVEHEKKNVSLLLYGKKSRITVVVLGIIHTCVALRYKPAFIATR